ncbi:MAG TPA: aldehyde dehydrogenase family protein, partial [Acidimicrobiales bacterium]|nr:aldehyde dehydrogenase family protein [Acidimicrobiales bacterium]
MTGRDDSVTVLEPATERVLAEVEIGDVEAAVTRARSAFPAWRGVPPAERSRVLLAIARILEDHSKQLA